MVARSFLLLFAVALAGCSGAGVQLVNTPPDAGAATSNPAPSAPASSASAGSGGDVSPNGQGNTEGGAGSASGTEEDAAVPPATTQCPPGGTPAATTSGDTALHPTPFDRVACGVVTPDESYFWTFTLPASASNFGLSFSGDVRLRLTLDGSTIDVTPGADLPFRTDDPYVLEVSAPGSELEPYVIVVTEK